MITNETVIKVEDLKKSFSKVEVLKGINIEIKKGEVVVVIGASGSGKSTFLRCLNRLEEPTDGKIYFGGQDITSLGTLLSAASQTSWQNYPHLMVFPALIISLLMICFNLFGNGLRDAFNPSLRGVEE